MSLLRLTLFVHSYRFAPASLLFALVLAAAAWTGTITARPAAPACDLCGLVVGANAVVELSSDTTTNCVVVEENGILDLNGRLLTLTGLGESRIDGELRLTRPLFEPSILRFALLDHTITGSGSIIGQHNDAKIEIAPGVTVTNQTTIQGRLTIKGLVLLTFFPMGAFVNNGAVIADDGVNANGRITVDRHAWLKSGTGEWSVARAGALLIFDAGSACSTEIGDLRAAAGAVYFDKNITFDHFTFNGGVLNGGATRLRYDSYSGDQPNPGACCDCGGTHEYVDF